jgi:hypothetical protein
MTIKLGVRFSPRVLEMLMRVGTRITGEHGFAVRLTEDGIPENFKLLNSGADPETGEFFLVFSEGGQKSPDPVQWQSPIYEKVKEASNGTDS